MEGRALNDPLILDEAEGLGEEAVLVEQFNEFIDRRPQPSGSRHCV